MGDVPVQPTKPLALVGKTFVSGTELVYNWLVVSTSSFISREKFEIVSPVFSSDDETKWQLILSSEHFYPGRQGVAVNLVKVSDDLKCHSVRYDLRLGDLFGRMFATQFNEHVFKDSRDRTSSCSVINRRMLMELSRDLQDDTLLVQCNMSILAGHSPDDDRPKAKLQSSLSSEADFNNLSTFRQFEVEDPDASANVNEAKLLNIPADKIVYNIDADLTSCSAMNSEGIDNDLAVFSSNLESLYKGKKYCDVVLFAGNVNIEAHRAILSARSAYFSLAFEENNDRRLDIKNVDGKILDDILFFAYTGRTRQISTGIAMNLLRANNTLKVPVLDQFCTHYIKGKLCDENVFEVLELAEELAVVKDLKMAALKYISSNPSVMSTKAWFTLLTKKPRIAGEILLVVDSIQKNEKRFL